MPVKPARAGGPAAGARVLLLARTADALPTAAPWDPRSHRWPWTAAAGGSADPAGGRGYDVAHLPADRPAGLLDRLRPAARGRPSRPALARCLRDVDVVWSLDAATDAALAAAPDLVAGRAVLPSSTWAAGSAALAALDRLLAEVAAVAPDAPARPSAADLDRWQAVAAALDPDDLPAALRPVDAVAEALRIRRRRGSGRAADRAVVALDATPWLDAARARSGLAARRAAADLSLGTLRWDAVDEAALAGVAAAAVQGADEALGAADPALALARLGDAASLLFHRARHAEVPRSALVEDPAAFLACLRGSRTYRTLLAPATGSGSPGHAPAPGAAPERADAPTRVLVATGAYGDFHGGVVAALEDVAEVRVRDLTQGHRELGRKVLDPWALPAVAALAALESGAAPAWVSRRLARVVRSVADPLREELSWPEVVLADWADPATVWVSHLCPPSVRLVVRVHALDALDPWLHLVRWDRVERVVTVSEPLRSLVADLLAAGSGAQVPVQVVPHVVPRLGDLARGKTPDARTTLGMVGWGRRVKDVHWALDLLERDDAWQLVLVGADFPPTVNPVVEPFVTRLRERLASPALRDRVHVVGQVDDVGEPLRRVGVILSTSVRESWHLGLVEGAASGAVPVVRDWPLLASRGGARSLFPDEWVVDDLDAAEARVRRVTAPGAWAREGERARAQALGLFDPTAVAGAYRRVLLDGAPPADRTVSPS